MKNFSFVIYAPPYNTKSGGHVVLHKLCHYINLLGYEAYIYLVSDPANLNNTNNSWHTPVANDLSKDKLSNSIIIYPEIVVGNPLNGKYVIRYLLNRENQFSQGFIKKSINDYILTYDKIYGESDSTLYVPNIDLTIFNGIDSLPFQDRSITLTYDGKGSNYSTIGIVEGSLPITRTQPESKYELAALLKKTMYLFTWDSNTALIQEAIMCGAVPILMQLKPNTIESIESSVYGISGYALSMDEFEIYRAVHTQKIAQNIIRSKIVNFKKELLFFIGEVTYYFNNK